MRLYGTTNVPVEWGFRTAKRYNDPFNDVDVDVVVTGSDGQESRVPAYWAGDGEWRVRFAGREAGSYRWTTVCSDASNGDLHGVAGSLDVASYEGSNPLFSHGPLRISGDRRHFEHADGTPFFWLGDTWWMALTKRLAWFPDFQTLVADRVRKGFTVAQIVAGLYPDMGAYDERGANESGFPWEPDWARIRPEYYDMADIRFGWLVKSGIVPCIVGCWGYYVGWLGVEKMKRHWRYLVARYSAYPVVWCLCGEAPMAYYLEPLPTPESRQEYRRRTAEAWAEIGAYVRSIDPSGHPVTAHPGGGETIRDYLDDAVLDFDMLQSGHDDRRSLPRTVESIVKSAAKRPRKPVINGEPCYEGIGEAGREEVMRLLFWVCMLNGAAGHTYGANGIWQVNTREKPYGPSPHGTSWGDTPWEDAYQLPGSAQMGHGKTLLSRYRWWAFEPHPEWVQPAWTAENYMLGYASGIPREVRVLFAPSFVRIQLVKAVESDVAYRAYYYNPKTGVERGLGAVTPDENGNWRPPNPPVFQDWVLVLETDTARASSA
jgi:hypothetical protein